MLYKHRNKILFILFFLSGFCGLLYQTVWIRLAFAGFGIIAPVLSVVISVFMLGLSLGSWLGGKYIRPLTERTKKSAIFFYALIEFLIGFGAFAVEKSFQVGQRLLLDTGESASFGYLTLSALVIAISVLPWCVLMGATFPFVMEFIKEQDSTNNTSNQSFSFLYLANVFGAIFGTIITAAFLIELFGFGNTLWIAAIMNFFIASLSFALGLQSNYQEAAEIKPEQINNSAIETTDYFYNIILFTTGFSSMAMEVVWTRNFIPVLGTEVYAFATLLVVYLIATWVGSVFYRLDLRKNKTQSKALIIVSLFIFGLLPILANDPQWVFSPKLELIRKEYGIYIAGYMALFSIFPFSAVLGYLTPCLIDDISKGEPNKAGKVYAINILGCILGPLVASYLLLPRLGTKLSLVLLALPFFFFSFRYLKTFNLQLRVVTSITCVALILYASVFSYSYEEPFNKGRKYLIKRDHSATALSFGEGQAKSLLVNGIGITYLTPITKFMAHLPLTFHSGKSESALVICFGMGTTYRSLMSWDINSTAVELSAAVKDSFGYFYEDANSILANPKGQIVADDGRRFLKRTNQQFDVITIDPPPPIETAGSSLLYSEQFYEVVKKRLKPNGILQQWFPRGEDATLQAVTRSLVNSFPYIKIYRSVEGYGYHYLASMTPIEVPTANQIVERLPQKARNDIFEMFDTPKNEDSETILKAIFNNILTSNVTPDSLLNPDTRISVTDDKPYNEYFFLRRLRKKYFSN